MEPIGEDEPILEIRHKTDAAGTLVVEVVGDVDISNADVLRRYLDTAMADPLDVVVFDVSSLGFMDSSGLAVVLEVAQRVGSVVLRRPSPLIVRVVEATGLSEILEIER